MNTKAIARPVPRAASSATVATFMPSAKSCARTARSTISPTSFPAWNAKPIIRPSIALWMTEADRRQEADDPGPVLGATRTRSRGDRGEVLVVLRVVVTRRAGVLEARLVEERLQEAEADEPAHRGDPDPERATLSPTSSNASGRRSTMAVATTTPAASAMSAWRRCRRRRAAYPPPTSRRTAGTM